MEEMDVTDGRYMAMRIRLVLRLQSHIQDALLSPWSNIRSICYGLICSMFKIDVQDCVKYLPVEPLDTEENSRRRMIE